MGKIFNTKVLEKELEKMRDLIFQREETFEMRSEKWQESEKGEIYGYSTSELDSAADALETLIAEINDIE